MRLAGSARPVETAESVRSVWQERHDVTSVTSENIPRLYVGRMFVIVKSAFDPQYLHE
jgi:hypothetical protein